MAEGLTNKINMVEFRQGEAVAFKAAYDAYYPQLYYFSVKLTKSTDVAEDIVIETFTKLFERHQKFENQPDIRGFLYRAARNAAFNYLKVQKRETERKRDFAYFAESSSAELVNEQIYGEFLTLIYKAVEELPAQCKRVFRLSYLDGIADREIAAQLRISESTVRSQKQRAISLLRILLKEHQFALAFLLYTYYFQHLNLSDIVN